MNPLLSDQSSDRSVADHRVLSSKTSEFDRCETSTLLIRTSLSKVGVVQSRRMMKGGNDSQSGSVTLHRFVHSDQHDIKG